MRLTELTEGLVGVKRLGSEDPEITGLAYHSSEVRPGSLFVAIRGMRLDGNVYIDKALSQGAAAVVSDSRELTELPVPLLRVADSRKALSRLSAVFTGHPYRDLLMFGITGTNGKTTVSLLLKSILEAAGLGALVIGTLGYSDPESGADGTMTPMHNTTPESLDLMCLLARTRGGGNRGAIMEVSSHALDQGRVADIRYDAALFTNLSRDHLDYHLTMEAYLAAKLKLFGLIKPGGAGVVNADDAAGNAFRDAWSGKVLTFGCESEADVGLAGDVSEALQGVLRIRTPSGEMTVHSRLKGRFNISNNLAAVAAATAAGIEGPTIVRGLEAVRSVPGRMEEVPWSGPFRVYVDYAHTPDSLEKVLSALRELASEMGQMGEGGRLITVFGAGGDRDRGKRPLMGRVVAELSDLSIVTSDNPRSEKPLKIIDEIRGGMGDAEHGLEPDRRKAIAKALLLASPGDIVLVAGKGHEPYQEINGVRHHFDDRETVTEELNRLLEGNGND